MPKLTRTQLNAARVSDSGDRPAYDAVPGVSQSRLRPFLKSVAHGVQSLNEPRKQTDAMLLGILAHAWALEGKRSIDQRYIVVPAGSPKRPTKVQLNAKKPSEETIAAIAWWSAFEKDNAGLEIVDADMLSDSEQVGDGIFKALNAYDITPLGTEVALTAEWGDLVLKGCLDIVTEDGWIYDVKTTGLEATREDWGRTLERDLGLALQMAFYSLLYRENFGEPPQGFRHLVVETKAPYGFRVFEADPDILAKGVLAMLQALDRYKEYILAGPDAAYPCYPVEVVKVAPWKPSASSPIPFA
jgi:exodeoxyribonuclease VIII